MDKRDSGEEKKNTVRFSSDSPFNLSSGLIALEELRACTTSSLGGYQSYWALVSRQAED